MFRKIAFFVLLVAAAIAVGNFVSAQEAYPSAVIERRAQLQKELDALESQIDGFSRIVDDKQAQTVSLERDLAIMDAKATKMKLEIKSHDLKIAQLAEDIKTQTGVIRVLGDKMQKEQDSLAEIIRRTGEMDGQSEVELILGYGNLSDFFVEVDTFDWLESEIHKSFSIVKTTKELTEKEKAELEDKKEEQTGLKAIQELERKRLLDFKTEKGKILKITKGEETKYKKYLTDTKKSAAAIRSQLFLLTGSAAIPFEKALEYANIAYKATGVRPAFLLGVITEESNLGQNVGKGNWRTDMKSPRDTEPFKSITSRLGLDPDQMPVSKKPWYGWGGAMGPAQFIPSTWVLYEKRIAKATGSIVPNPWDPKDAFAAAAILLADNGADAGTAQAERTAALKYLAGSNWKKKSYAFYGDDVMGIAKKYQEQIEILGQ